jgi:hypothetical protein
MRPGFIRLLPAIALVLVATACRDTPLDPLTAHELGITVLQRADVLPAAPFTTEALFRTALIRLHRERGTAATLDAASPLLARYAELDRVEARGDRHAVEQARAAVRDAQLRFILDVEGMAAIERTLSGVASGIEALRTGSDAGPGRAAESRAAAVSAEQLLFDARAARQRGEYLAALDLVTRAAGRLERGRVAASAAQRLDGLDALYRQALERAGPDEAAAQEGDRERLLAAAAEAVERGDRRAAQQLLEAARATQIRAVLATLGDAAVVRLAAATMHALAAVAHDIERARPGGDELTTQLRMVRSARELLARSKLEFARGDAAAALDMASHAAGLVDALRMPPAEAR